MKEIVFLADFYTDVIRGGAEIVNEVLIQGLEDRGYKVTKLETTKTNSDVLKKHKNKTIVVGNFVLLEKEPLDYLKTMNYIIFEHDHKYLKSRDPSGFENYVAPPHEIIHRDFYQNALAVFCQSKIHAEVVERNLGINNIINLGCSLWSDDELEAIRAASKIPKNNKCAVLESGNRIKGTRQAIVYCNENKLDYNLIHSKNYKEFISQLAQHESLVFFPQVLESFCRLVVEARMLNCKLRTNKNNGCTSEEWFAKHRGSQLIDYVASCREENIDKVAKVIQRKSGNAIPIVRKKSDITVIVNSYRRPYNLPKQIEAIRNQTIEPNQVWLWVNAHEDNKGWDYSPLAVDRVFNNDHNWKFYGRFAAALLADTEYVAIFDDDTIPGNKWFENCLNTMETHEGILGSAGVILNGDKYVQHTRCGWPTHNSDITQVDLVGHAWFFKRDWLQYLWREKPTTWDNGEDIQFSYLAQKYGGIQTYCPAHPTNNTQMHGSILGNELGIDAKATSTNHAVSYQKFFSERDLCVQTAIKGGWDTVNRIKTK
jgi:hypothetical protein